MWSRFKTVVVWLAGAIGIAPLISKAIEKWAERNGYLEDPSKGLHWLLSLLSSAAESPFFYPLVAFLVGLGVGLWLDSIVRSATNDSELELKSIGYNFLDLADELSRRASLVVARWPDSIGDIFPRLQSAFVRAGKAGIWAPPPSAFKLNDEGDFVRRYLTYTGRMLADGHYNEAKRFIVSAQEQLASLQKKA